MVYLESLFPSAKRCSEEPIKLLLGEELHRQKFFEHIQRHLIVALSRGERSQPHSADEG
jgi:hypothetical protein